MNSTHLTFIPQVRLGLAFLVSLVAHYLVLFYFPKTEHEKLSPQFSIEVSPLDSRERDGNLITEIGSYDDQNQANPSATIIREKEPSRELSPKEVSDSGDTHTVKKERRLSEKISNDLEYLLTEQIKSEQDNFYSTQGERIRTIDRDPQIGTITRLYLNSWERKVEKIGNLNYPQEAKRKKLYGSLLLLASILPNGNLKEVRIVETSGHEVLDRAALSIVQMAAPFAPFPKEMEKEIDLLEIIRIWQFRKNSYWETG